MNLPKISIVTPSYNQGQFVEDTILSVKNQDYPDFEHIIIDGGSTDNTLEILKKYEKSYNMRWTSEPDEGQSDALNKGFTKSTGQIVAWINSDDVYLPRAFMVAAKTFEKNPDAAIIYGDYIKIDEESRCVALRRQPSFNYKICLYGYLTVMQPASFFQRKAFFDAKMIDTSFNYAMDYDLIVRLAQQGEVVHIREYLAAFRLHSTSKSVTDKAKFWNEDCKMRAENLGRNCIPGELPILFRFYQIRAILRMFHEGCLPSRFGMDDGEYKLNEIYRPGMLGP